MGEFYEMKDIQVETGLDRQTLDRYFNSFNIEYEGSNKPRTASRRRRIDDESLKQIKLIAALQRDVKFEKYEIRSILKKTTVDEFLQLFTTLPFPRLLEELRKRNVKIDTTAHLECLLRLVIPQATAANGPIGTTQVL